MKIVTYINEKGGVGKTSVCFNAAWELATQGKKILMIDMDGQTANLSFFADIDKDNVQNTIIDVVKGRCEIADAAVEVKDNLWLVPADAAASDMGMDTKLTAFRKALKKVNADYDYVFVDVNPSPGRAHYLSLSVSDYAVITMLPDVASLEGNSGILDTIEEIQETTNSDLKIVGILFNRFTGTNLSKMVNDVVTNMAEEANTSLFSTVIPQAVAFSEAVGAHVGITEYDPSSKAAESMKAFVAELEERTK